MITFETAELNTNETLKPFETPDALAKSYLELQGKVSSGDLSIIPEDVRKDPTVQRYKNIPDLARGLIEANKVIGGIKKAPEKPEDYKFTTLQNLHKNLGDVGGTVKALANMFHKVGLDQDKADQLQQAILTGLSTGFQRSDEARATKAKETETALRADWKDKYDTNYKNVENVLKLIGLEDLVPDLQGNPKRLAGFHKLTALLSEDSLKGLETNTNQSNKDIKSKEGAKARIDEIMKSPELRAQLSDEKNPKHKEMVTEWKAINEAAYAT